MGFLRFRRSFRIMPGLRINLSKSGASASVGRRGAWFTLGPRGTRATIGIPGTGISYTEVQPTHTAGSAPRFTSAGEIPCAPPATVEQSTAQSEPTQPAPAESEPITISAEFVILGLAAIIALAALAIALFR